MDEYNSYKREYIYIYIYIYIIMLTKMFVEVLNLLKTKIEIKYN